MLVEGGQRGEDLTHVTNGTRSLRAAGNRNKLFQLSQHIEIVINFKLNTQENLISGRSDFWHIAFNPACHGGSGFFSTLSHLPYRNNRKDLCKKGIKEHEERDAACQNGPLHPGRNVEGSLCGHSLSCQCRDDNDKPFQPHSQNDRDRGDDRPSDGSVFPDGKNG